MSGECLESGWHQTTADLSALDIVVVFLLAFLLAVVIAPFVLWRYQRVVERLMKAHTSVKSAPHTDITSLAKAVPTTALHDVLPEAALPSLAEIEGRMRRAHSAAANAAWTFAVIAAFVMTPAAMIFDELNFLSLLDWMLSAAYACLVAGGAVAPLVLMYAQSRYGRPLLAVAFVLLVAVVSEDIWFHSGMPTDERLINIGIGALIVILIYLGLVGRRLRNAVPLLTLYLAILLAALYLGLLLVAIIAPCFSGSSAWLLVPLLFALPWTLNKLGQSTLPHLTRAYEHRAFSDDQFQIGLWFLVIVIALAMETTPYSDDAVFSWWSVGVFLAGAVAVFVYVRRLALQKPWPAPRSMLLLRVFSGDRAAQRLLDEVTYRWSFIGPIHLVAGPDLAKSYLEPHELLLFLQRRFQEQFVLSRDDLTRRLERLENLTYPDGRYGINEFFCMIDTWKFTVDHLVDLAEVILLDLRGLDATRSGASFEVTLLARKGVLDRTILLYDEQTSERALQKALEQVPGASIAPDRIVHARNVPDSADIVKLLLDGL